MAEQEGHVGSIQRERVDEVEEQTTVVDSGDELEWIGHGGPMWREIWWAQREEKRRSRERHFWWWSEGLKAPAMEVQMAGIISIHWLNH